MSQKEEQSREPLGLPNEREGGVRGLNERGERKGEGMGKKKEKALNVVVKGFWGYLPDDNLLSHWLQHYHRRNVVSRSCSGWEGVVPTCYGHQA